MPTMIAEFRSTCAAGRSFAPFFVCDARACAPLVAGRQQSKSIKHSCPFRSFVRQLFKSITLSLRLSGHCIGKSRLHSAALFLWRDSSLVGVRCLLMVVFCVCVCARARISLQRCPLELFMLLFSYQLIESTVFPPGSIPATNSRFSIIAHSHHSPLELNGCEHKR